MHCSLGQTEDQQPRDFIEVKERKIYSVTTNKSFVYRVGIGVTSVTVFESLNSRFFTKTFNRNSPGPDTA